MSLKYNYEPNYMALCSNVNYGVPSTVQTFTAAATHLSKNQRSVLKKRKLNKNNQIRFRICNEADPTGRCFN